MFIQFIYYNTPAVIYNLLNNKRNKGNKMLYIRKKPQQLLLTYQHSTEASLHQ